MFDKHERDEPLEHVEMREMLDTMLKGETDKQRMVTLRMSVLAAPVLAELLTIGLSIFSATHSDLEKADAVDARFAKMALASKVIEQMRETSPERYERLMASAPSDVRTYLSLPPDERDDSRRAHKAMTLLSIAEVATFPEELKAEVTRIMAEKGTVSEYHMPPQAVKYIDEYVEARRRDVALDEDEVRVLLIGQPEKVKEFATKHGLNPDDLLDTTEEASDD